MASLRKKATRLSQDSLIKLGDYLRANKNNLESSVHTHSSVAKSASEFLGFPISVNSISRVAAMVNVSIKVQNNGGVVNRRIRHKQIKIIREHLIALYEKCGEPVPHDLQDGWPLPPPSEQ